MSNDNSECPLPTRCFPFPVKPANSSSPTPRCRTPLSPVSSDSVLTQLEKKKLKIEQLLQVIQVMKEKSESTLRDRISVKRRQIDALKAEINMIKQKQKEKGKQKKVKTSSHSRRRQTACKQE